MGERVSPHDIALPVRPVESTESSRTRDFDYPLDERLIAQRPLNDRDASRLLTVRRTSREFEDRSFRELPALMSRGDVLVLNDTRVFPARLLGRKPTGAAAEILLVEQIDADGSSWRALVRPGGKLKPGRVVEIAEDLQVIIEESTDGGSRRVRLVTPLRPMEAVARHGHMPLPPYIRRLDDEADRARYQTIYADEEGSVAAPTAGLHFTPRVLAEIAERGVEIARITLHVGPGTFRPVETSDPRDHRLDAERYRVGRVAAETINRGRERGAGIWAVGTTTVRTLEAVADERGFITAREGTTDLFVRPGYNFRAVDHLITNFHLPRSTLLMLVAAFAGRDLTMAAYRHAMGAGYRFYSYGDAMVIV
jgi:S-adenosylmethionine:tRNA ribosyltransferase-isomerase